MVLARKRQNEDPFALPPKQVELLPRPRWRNFRRWWFAKVKKQPVPLTDRQVIEGLYALQKHAAQVMHVYFGNIAAELLPLLRVVRTPVVVSFHGADAGVDADKPAYRAALREVFDLAELVLARSTSLLDQLRSLGCPEQKLRLNRAGAPAVHIPFTERETPPAKGAWRFLQVCRLVEKKGLPVALRAFAKVVERHPEAHFDIAGDGPLRGELEALAGELGLGGRVTFHGFLNMDAVTELSRAAHFFVHPSQTAADGNREGVPNAMLEAMCTGTPVLATLHGGIPEAVEDRVAGRLVDEGDAGGLAAAALELLAAPDRYPSMSRAAARLDRQHLRPHQNHRRPRRLLPRGDRDRKRFGQMTARRLFGLPGDRRRVAIHLGKSSSALRLPLQTRYQIVNAAPQVRH